MSGKVLQPLFVGYSSLEELGRVVDLKRPVYVALFTEPGKHSQHDQHTDAMVIMIAQPDEDIVNYCRLTVGSVQYVGDLPLYGKEDVTRKETLAEQAKTIVKDWLLEKGLKILPGVIATPNNTRFLDGWADFLVFDTGTQAYCRK